MVDGRRFLLSAIGLPLSVIVLDIPESRRGAAFGGGATVLRLRAG